MIVFKVPAIGGWPSPFGGIRAARSRIFRSTDSAAATGFGSALFVGPPNTTARILTFSSPTPGVEDYPTIEPKGGRLLLSGPSIHDPEETMRILAGTVFALFLAAGPAVAEDWNE